MNYPDIETYRKLYARYLSWHGRSVDQLLDLAGKDFTGMRVLDLCGGGGEMAEGARKRNAEYVLLVDGCEGMIGERDPGIDYAIQDVEDFLTEPFWKQEKQRFDVVLCRQAVNYWMTEEMAEELGSIIHPGGVFVFNTFNSRPSMIPKVKEYKFEMRQYMEASWLDKDGETVHHVQCCEGEPPHVTSFKWIPMMRLEDWLGAHFKVSREQDVTTHLFRCVRKKSK